MFNSDERQWGMLAHIITAVANVLTGFGWLAALIIYLVKKDESKFVAFHSLQQLYFQIGIFCAAIVSVILMIVLIGFVLLPIVILAGIIFPIVAGIKANSGELYELPIVGVMARRQVGI